MQDAPRSDPANPSSAARPTVLVTGATGYVGGRLIPALLKSGYAVRCVVREPRKLAQRTWRNDPHVEVLPLALEDTDTLARAMRGCSAAYYLVHSMIAANDEYRSRDSALAASFAIAAQRGAVGRIIYLGGLGELGDDLSEHLTSRREVEQILSASGVPVTTLRAAMIIGSGSASFEILRYLVEHLPMMVTPSWVRTESQPISIRNVIHYLVTCLEVQQTVGKTLDIGGPEVVTYRSLMDTMAESRGLPRRVVLQVPVLTPRLSSLWIHLVTPVPHTIARPLAEGLRNRTVCRDQRAAELMPQPLLSMREAIDAALGKQESDDVATAWTDAGLLPGDPDWAGGISYSDRHEAYVEADAAATFAAVMGIGGRNGWYGGNWLWRLRGLMDKVIGGPGLRRGRRDQNSVVVGDALDFWRVVDVRAGEALTLRAEMKLPGTALLDFEVRRDGSGCCLATTARFQPRGLAGILYWYSVLPLHVLVFRGMLRGLKKAAERNAAAAASA